ncbi:hypothetical protein [Acinetobacter tjernbergiae]|uniref:Uncharacterized protein n=1 Tax=Acinetobacter tjernbergiae DSM 14971 = CIP 107465 TaxID=1120928 RepID=V2V096_9GAMM|nr:hypothetical protein [Acinetobacter tjernbergiae]ESK54315.1 hypothetical protein F990_02773 [Acinetobacter tjernbergiae DSM 14971 = CIP 107465]
MPHSSIKFKNETDYSFFAKMTNFNNKPDFINLRLEPVRNKSHLWMDAAVITIFSFGFFVGLNNELANEMINSLILIKANQYEPTLFQNSNIFDDKGFSLHHTFMYEVNESTSIKFLFNKDWNVNEFNTACHILMRELKAFEISGLGQIPKFLNGNKTSDLIVMSIDVNFDVIYSI